MIKDMGDVLLTGPMAEVLKYNFPKAQVDILVSPVCAPVLKNAPYIDNLIIYDKTKAFKEILKVRALKYDWVIDFLNNPRSAMICALSGAKLKAGLQQISTNFTLIIFTLRNRKQIPIPVILNLKCLNNSA